MILAGRMNSPSVKCLKDDWEERERIEGRNTIEIGIES
jgi:hypothetical protein